MLHRSGKSGQHVSAGQPLHVSNGEAVRRRCCDL